MLKNAYLLAKIGADTAENELNSAEILPIGRRVAMRGYQFNGARRSSTKCRLACTPGTVIVGLVPPRLGTLTFKNRLRC